MDCRLAALVLCPLLLTACPKDRGGGGTPPVCGMVTPGGTCAASEDCVCGHSCIAGACTRLVNPPMEPTVPAPTPLMIRLCNEVNALPCTNPDNDCPQEIARERARAAERGCGQVYDQALMCVDRANLMCDPDGNDIMLPTECLDEFEATETGACAACVRSTECGGAPVPPPPPPPTDGGIATRDAGTPDTPTCFTGYGESCGNEPQQSARMACRQEVIETGMIWVCTCEEGARTNVTFGVRSDASSCCEFAELAKDQCGLN